MAELKFTIPDDRMDDLIEAWSQGWSAKLLDGTDNPQSQAAFAKERIRLSIIHQVQHYQAQQSEFPIT